ncbi:MAG: YjgP/YjgQ family permease [Planctomycetota bacterium]|nr:MAG: YjgP/YjgQ family permease [Planctomycetota bacterium]
MLSVIDRYILRSLVFNYAVSLGTMLSLYVVLDLFVNMDEFTEHGYPTWTVVGHVIDYYWPNLFLYFSQLSGVITLFACVATIARMRRHNEMTAVLASGVSLYRLARPVLAFGIMATGLMILDTEWIIPKVAYKLARDHDDVPAQHAYEVLFLPDRDGALLSARRFHPTDRDLKGLLVMRRDEHGALMETLEADQAVWIPPRVSGAPGVWELRRARRTRRLREETAALGPRSTSVVDYPTRYESLLSPEDIQLRQSEGWIRFLSLRQLEELKRHGSADLTAILQTEHARRTAPIVAVILLLLGLPFFLDRSPTNMLSDTGRCVLVCGACYVSTFLAQSIQLGTTSAWPAWIPIFVFGTTAVVLIDRIRT